MCTVLNITGPTIYDSNAKITKQGFIFEPPRKQEDKCERQCVAQILDFAAKIIESEIQFKYFAATVQEASDQRQY